MNHKHRKILHAVFAHPMPHNIDPKGLNHLLEALGGEVETAGKGGLTVRLNGHQGTFHFGEHDVPGAEVVRLRRLIEEAGIEPARDYPL